MTPRLGLRATHERTLESLYRRHAADVYRYALMMLDSAADAEDVTQTTFLNAYRALLRGERPRATDSWLRMIAHNLCLQQFRQASRRPREVELEDETPALASDHEAFLVEDLSRALRQIPVNQRAALLMRELEGRPVVEIADILGISGSAVETLLFRARRAVREQLEGSLTCAQAEQAISAQLDGRLNGGERGALRAHLRECPECARLARSLRAQRGALRSLAAIPLPAALAWGQFGPGAAVSGVATANAGAGVTGGAWLAGSVASKLAGAAVLAGLASGVGYVAALTHPWTGSRPAAKLPVPVGATERHGGSAAAPGPASSVPLTGGVLNHSVPAHRGSARSSATRQSGATKATRSHAMNASASTIHPAAASNEHGHGSGVRSTFGRHAGQGTGTGHPAHPTHSGRPGHTAKPTHPAHPAHPTRPATPTSATTPTTTTKHPTLPGSGKRRAGGG